MYGVECWVNCFMQKRLQFANLVGLGWLYNAAVLISVTAVLIMYSILKINRLRILMQAMQNVATKKDEKIANFFCRKSGRTYCN